MPHHRHHWRNINKSVKKQFYSGHKVWTEALNNVKLVNRKETNKTIKKVSKEGKRTRFKAIKIVKI